MIFAAACIGTSGEAMADPPFMETGAVSSRPFGHVEFCERHSSECRRYAVTSRPTTAGVHDRETIERVNREVNGRLSPVSDQDRHGVEEFWEYPVDGSGDCEDYVLEKRRVLLDLGFSRSDLPITIALREGRGHAVLVVRTSEGDLVLDNFHDEVRRWTDLPYRFLKRQMLGHDGRWVAIVPETPAVQTVAELPQVVPFAPRRYLESR